MEYIKEWLKTILYMNIFLLICDNLMKKTAYEKYYRFFSGFLLMICLMKPVIDLSGAGGLLNASFLKNEFSNELKLIEQTDDLKDVKRTIEEEYTLSYQKQIREIARQYHIEPEKITVKWNPDHKSVNKIEIEGREEEKSNSPPEISSLKETLTKFYGIRQEKIKIEIKEQP
ncbi:MAG: stage III sporulation protein AF [Lachnospiraceae bacterium]|nr:stage III sporulation protein AF [Lachnospiraceae bacterium]MDY5497506.1 stage III sporulation protein AF [Anaerobutyricum sp.]